jgi:hypothetical protein
MYVKCLTEGSFDGSEENDFGYVDKVELSHLMTL